MEILGASALTGTERNSLIQDRAEKPEILLSLLTNLFGPDILCIGGIDFNGYTELEPAVLQILEQRSPLNIKKALTIQTACEPSNRESHRSFIIIGTR